MLSEEQIALVIAELKPRGFDVPAETVREFAQYGSIPQGVVSGDYDEALEEALADEFDKLGIARP